MKKILFNKPALTENAQNYIIQSLKSLSFENDYFTKKAMNFLQEITGARAVLLTNSCTSALEMAALLLEIGPGDEIIMPSYTFVSSANAFVLRGATPVFLDIRPDTLNIDEKLIVAAITPKTKAILVMHYAGVGCDMELIQKIANKYHLPVVEDAAQCILASYKNRALGTFGDLGTYSFHHTKNITSGFGGALLINNEKLIDRAKIIWQKGTNREAFISGAVDKYTWVDIGSAYLLNEINAALLCSQLENAKDLIQLRMKIWNKYHHHFSQLDTAKIYSLPVIPPEVMHNAHIYYLILDKPETRQEFMQYMRNQGIETTFHYIPLHSSPAGIKYGEKRRHLPWTDHHAARIVRLPLYASLSDEEVDYIIYHTLKFFNVDKQNAATANKIVT